MTLVPVSLVLPVSLARLRPADANRWLLVCATTNCGPCDALSAALLQDATLCRFVVISKRESGDVALRSAHLQAGAKTYPTVILMSGDTATGRTTGFLQDDDGPVLSDYHAYLKLDGLNA